MEQVGFIGTGNMASALARAVCKSRWAQGMLLADSMPGKAQALAQELGCTACDNETVAKTAQIIFLGVKPQVMKGLLETLAPVFRTRKDRFVLVTMAAALSSETVQTMSGGRYPVIRVMPNTPASLGCGVLLYCGRDASEADLAAFQEMMAPAGLVDSIQEPLIDAASAISGCGPAFCYLFIESLADGGVACGLPREQALKYAAKMVEGSARMVLESGNHPGELKDQVCSPGGTTIQGVRKLEEKGLRSAALEAVLAAYEKTLSLK